MPAATLPSSGNNVVHSAADPDRDVQEIAAGLIRFVSLAHLVVVYSAEEKAADIYRAAFGHHRAEKTASLGAAGHSNEGDRPVSALRPILVNRLQSGAQHRQSPRRGIVLRLDRRVRRQDHPALGVRRRMIPFRIHGACPVIVRG